MLEVIVSGTKNKERVKPRMRSVTSTGTTRSDVFSSGQAEVTTETVGVLEPEESASSGNLTVA